ncbi:lysosomal cystine transporter [Colletotrichum higginsianum]|nr:lysosomal cystine transporter [Colletotrichum higginsianum]
MAVELLPFLSAVFGWIYFLCWSGSFYPQPLLNFRRKTTAGTTVDFPLINCLGFLAYFVSNAAFYYSPLLWGFAPAHGTKPSRFISGIAAGCVVGVIVIGFVVAAAPGDGDPRTSWCALDVVYAVSYVKLVITLIKYTPQVITNYRNKSTKGWSIWQILLDFSGGLLSVGQQAIDSYMQRDWSGITGNPVKFALGNVSMVYDVVFMTQHYILYRGSDGKADERDSLLRGDDEEHQRLD